LHWSSFPHGGQSADATVGTFSTVLVSERMAEDHGCQREFCDGFGCRVQTYVVVGIEKSLRVYAGGFYFFAGCSR